MGDLGLPVVSRDLRVPLLGAVAGVDATRELAPGGVLAVADQPPPRGSPLLEDRDDHVAQQRLAPVDCLAAAQPPRLGRVPVLRARGRLAVATRRLGDRDGGPGAVDGDLALL